MAYDETIDERVTGHPSVDVSDYQDAEDYFYHTMYGDQPYVLAEGIENAGYGLGGGWDGHDLYSLGVLYAGDYVIRVKNDDWFSHLENAYDLSPGSLDLWAYNSDSDVYKSADWNSSNFRNNAVSKLDMSLANPWLSFNNPPYRDYAQISFTVHDPIHLQVDFEALAGNSNLWEKQVAYKIWYEKVTPANELPSIGWSGVAAQVEGSSAIGSQVIIDSLLGDNNGVSDKTWNLNHADISFMDPIVTWYADGVPINRTSESVMFSGSYGDFGSFDAALTTTLAEAGKEITAKISFTDSAGYREELWIDSGIEIDNKSLAYDGAFETIEILPLESVLPIGTDYSNDPLTYAAGAEGPSYGTVEIQPDGSFLYNAIADYIGQDSFSYIVTDGALESDEATITISVQDGNVSPVASDAAYNTAEETLLIAKIPDATDPENLSGYQENDPLTYEIGSVAPASGTLIFEADGTFNYTPQNDFAGDVTFSYRAYDTALYSSEATITINVINVNDLPIASDTSALTSEDTPHQGSLPRAIDPDSQDTHTYLLGSQLPSLGTVKINPDGTYLYTPTPDFFGTDFFSYVVNDGTGLPNEATVKINILAVDDFPGVSAEVDILNGTEPPLVCRRLITSSHATISNALNCA